MKVVTKFYADDGREFPTAIEVIDYEFKKKVKSEFGFDDAVCQTILDGSGRLRYLIDEYMKQFPDK